MDIQVKFEFGEAVPANTTAYAIIISDRFYKLSSDGKNMSVFSIKNFYYIYNICPRGRTFSTVLNVKRKLPHLILYKLLPQIISV